MNWLCRLGGAAVVVASGAAATTAQAGAITSAMSIQYFEVAHSSDADFSGGPGFNGATPNVANGSALGPDGLPVVSSSSPGIKDYTSGSHELTWWSPAFNTYVVATGSGTVALPFSSNMYGPNSTGSNDSAYYETAVLRGSFDLLTAGSASFKLGSDDDSFIYVDGVLIGQNAGIHGITNVSFSTGTLQSGYHQLEIFYADRKQTGAGLSVSVQTSGVLVQPVPEPSGLPLLAAGMIGLASVRRRQRG